jgi:CheY-like chemotaxis protein
MKLRFWGTRGSIASPGPGTNHFGGNTSCVEVETGSGKRFLIDCGTGARGLGAHWMATAPKPLSATILLSHTHWDHIQGFPFFAPVFVPGNRFLVCGPEGCNKSLPDVLAGQMEFTYFPVQLSELGAEIRYSDIAEGTTEIDGVHISAQYLNHPAMALGYRIEADGVMLTYLCDHEPFSTTLWRADAPPGHIDSILHKNDRRHAEFMRNSDVVIHDAQYTPEEYPAKKNWGHSPFDYVVRIAAAAGVKKLFLTHHDPTHDDAFLRETERRARELAADAGANMEVYCAYEGCEETVKQHSPDGKFAAGEQAAGHIEGCGLHVLVVDDDEDVRILVRRALSQGGHFVEDACGGAEALAKIAKKRPDLIVLDLHMPPPDGMEVLRRLRSAKETASLPVLILTASGDENSTRQSFESGATDYLSKPFSAPQLETRVRTCFARASAADRENIRY